MREIKFRPWATDDVGFPNRMIYDVAVFPNGRASDGHGDSWYGLKNATLMQFTGLKDKDGKEIYEGDICRVSIPLHGDREFVVKWSEEFARFDIAISHSKNKDEEAHWVPEHEVIGNIYENPELLHQSKPVSQA